MATDSSLIRWQRVWNKRAAVFGQRFDLADLLRLDGFDSGAGFVAEADWRAYVQRRAAELNVVTGSSIFEVGCGAGAFLWLLYEHGVSVSGLDYSRSLVACARHAMPRGRWQVNGADHAIAPASCDVVVANSVFHYFPDGAYAERVLRNMLSAARQAVGVFDVPHARLSAAATAHRRAALGEAEYARRYAGLDHLSFTPDWFRERAPAAWAVRVQPQDIPNYGNNRFRFNVVMTRLR